MSIVSIFTLRVRISLYFKFVFKSSDLCRSRPSACKSETVIMFLSEASPLQTSSHFTHVFFLSRGFKPPKFHTEAEIKSKQSYITNQPKTFHKQSLRCAAEAGPALIHAFNSSGVWFFIYSCWKKSRSPVMTAWGFVLCLNDQRFIPDFLFCANGTREGKSRRTERRTRKSERCLF